MSDTHRPWGDLTPEEQDTILRERDKDDAERFRWLVMQPIYIELFRRFGAVTWQFNDLDDARQTIDAAMKEDGE